MSRTHPSKIRDAVRYMLDRNRLPEALNVLQSATDNIRQARDWRVLRQIWEQPQQQGDKMFTVEPVMLLKQTSWRILIGRILAGSQDEIELEHWLKNCLETTGGLEPELVVLEAFVMICAGRYLETKTSLNAVLPKLNGYWLGLAHQRLLWASHRLHEPWEHHLLEVRRHLQGHALGLALLNATACLYSEHRTQQAKDLALETLAYLKDDTYHTAWIKYQIGLNLLRECDPQAEQYFLQALAETFKSEGKPLRAKALAGVAAYRRFQGEWRIALEFYRRAHKAAIEINDSLEQFQIMLNMARTYRLEGQYIKSKNTLENILKQNLNDPSDFWLELAATNLKLEMVIEAENALKKVTKVFGADIHLESILKAQLAWQLGNELQAFALLQTIPIKTRVAREETRQFFDLFAWAQQNDLKAPEVLSYPTRTVVRVVQNTKTRIWINDRALRAFDDSQDIRVFLHMLRFPKHKFTASDLALVVFGEDEIPNIDSIPRDLMVKIIKRLKHRLEYPESIRTDG